MPLSVEVVRKEDLTEDKAKKIIGDIGAGRVRFITVVKDTEEKDEMDPLREKLLKILTQDSRKKTILPGGRTQQEWRLRWKHSNPDSLLHLFPPDKTHRAVKHFINTLRYRGVNTVGELCGAVSSGTLQFPIRGLGKRGNEAIDLIVGFFTQREESSLESKD